MLSAQAEFQSASSLMIAFACGAVVAGEFVTKEEAIAMVNDTVALAG